MLISIIAQATINTGTSSWRNETSVINRVASIALINWAKGQQSQRQDELRTKKAFCRPAPLSSCSYIVVQVLLSGSSIGELAAWYRCPARNPLYLRRAEQIKVKHLPSKQLLHNIVIRLRQWQFNCDIGKGKLHLSFERGRSCSRMEPMKFAGGSQSLHAIDWSYNVL